MLKFKILISLLIWIGGWTLTGFIMTYIHLPHGNMILGVILLGLSVGSANLFLEKTTEHDDDIDIIRDRKLKEILG